MILQISEVLPREQITEAYARLTGEGAGFASGKATAGWYVREIKQNEQAGGEVADEVLSRVRQALMANAVFRSAARPKEFVRVLISRYRPGMAYGTHVDDALMEGKRTDMSFTLFLSDPANYDGGELVIEGNDGDSDIKLGPGSLVLYPTTSLHRVNEVTRGERLAVVGWVRSFIRSPEQRETLFDLDQAIAGLQGSGVARQVSDRIFKVRNNLTRMWAED